MIRPSVFTHAGNTWAMYQLQKELLTHAAIFNRTMIARIPDKGFCPSLSYAALLFFSLSYSLCVLIFDFFQIPVRYNMYNITAEIPLLTTTEYQTLRTPSFKTLSQNQSVTKRNTHSLVALIAIVTSV